MRNRLLFLFVALMGVACASSTFAQQASSEWQVDCGGTFDLCGYKDPATGKLMIPRRFELADKFSNGLAGVRINRRFGFIDEHGDVVIAPIYDGIGPFRNDLAEVQLRGKSGVIDRKGAIVVEPQFEAIVPLSRDLMFASEADVGRWGRGGFRTGISRGVFLMLLFSGDYGLYSAEKGWVRKSFVSHFALFDDNNPELVWAMSDDGRDLYGLLRKDGTWQIEPSFTHVEALENDLAQVCQSTTSYRMESCGAVNSRGELVVPIREGFQLSSWKGYGKLRIDKKEGVVDYAGRLIGGRMFDSVEFPKSGKIVEIWTDGEKYGLNLKGEIVASPDEGEVLRTCAGGVKFIMRSRSITAVNAAGQQILPYVYRGYGLGGNCNAPLNVMLGKKWTYLKPDGHLLFDPPPFDGAGNFKNGLAQVYVGKKHGIIDTSGRYIVEPRSGQIFPDDGLFFVDEGESKYWIDALGNRRPPPFRKAMRDDALACGYEGAKIFARAVDGKRLWGIADATGRTIIEPRHRAITCFERGVAWVTDDGRKQWCAVLPNGKPRKPAHCIDENYLKFAHRYQQFSSDPYENSVRWTLAMLEFGIGERAEPPDSEIVE